MRSASRLTTTIAAYSLFVAVITAGCASISSTPDVAPAPTQWKEVSAGSTQTCGLAGDDSIWCWGIGAGCPGLDKDALIDLSVDTPAGGDNHECLPQRVNSDARWRSVSASERGTSCGIKDDGTLWCWGSSLNPSQVEIEDDWKMISTGENRCGVRENGTMWCGWGLLMRVGQQQDWRQVSVGQRLKCAITTEGSLRCWGRLLERWDLDAESTDEPIEIDSRTDWAQVDCGGRHCCGLRDDDSLWCWGESDVLGLENPKSLQPEPIGDDDGWQTVSVGSRHACASREDETLWCWGEALYGQLGLGDTTDRSEPVKLETPGQWADFSAGKHHNCGLDESGTMWCWGKNTRGQLGAGREIPSEKVRVAGDRRFKGVSAGQNHACAVADDRTLWCWGSARGTIPRLTRSYPEQIGEESDWRRAMVIASRGVGGSPQGVGTCGIRHDGSYSCWEYDRPEQMRRNSGGDEGWLDISFGREHRCGVRNDHTLWCWGRSDKGQLGLGWEEREGKPGRPYRARRPSRVGIDADWKMVSTHEHTSCGLRLDGTIWCWGDGVNEPEQVGTSSDWEYISHGHRSCGIRTEGTLWCWGDWRNFDPLQIGESSDWKYVDAGSFSCGLRSPGTLWCWDFSQASSLNEDHQVGSRTDWKSVSVGRDLVGGRPRVGVVLDQDGVAYSWGFNNRGQLGDGSWWIPYPVQLGSEKGRFHPWAIPRDLRSYYEE